MLRFDPCGELVVVCSFRRRPNCRRQSHRRRHEGQKAKCQPTIDSFQQAVNSITPLLHDSITSIFIFFVKRVRALGRRTIVTTVVGLSLSGICVAQGVDAYQSALKFMKGGGAAIEKGDWTEAHKAWANVLSIRPGYPRARYAMAIVSTATGEPAEAKEWLEGLADAGLTYDIRAEPRFSSLRKEAWFENLAGRLEANSRPTNNATTVVQLSERDLLTEGVAVDSRTGRIFVASVHKRKIVSWDEKLGEREFSSASDSLLGMFGLAVDATRNRLWGTSAALPQTEGYTDAMEGRSFVVLYDLTTGRLIRKFAPNDSSKHLFGDITVGPDGTVYVSDSEGRSIWTIDANATTFSQFAAPDGFVSPQGMALSRDGKRLFVADYIFGIFSLDLATKEARQVPVPAEAVMYGIDGLARYGDDLIAVQNGVNPHRIIRMKYDSVKGSIGSIRVLERGNDNFSEPTIGVVVGEKFIFNAASQWGKFDDKTGKPDTSALDRPIIMELDLRTK